jgi:hypothetical protein
VRINDLIIILIVSGIGLYFFVSGLRGFRADRMTVVNPDHGDAWPGFLGYFLHRMRRKAGVQESDDEDSAHMVIHGRAMKWRARFYIVFGIICFFVAVFYMFNVVPV